MLFEGFTLETREANGQRIRLRRGGSGPPLLLLHGNPQTHTMWHRVAPALARAWPMAQPLRYGENPHQRAALFGDFHDLFQQLHGKELSYNNILDTGAAAELIEEFPAAEAAAVAIVKHTNPCGVGTAATLAEAWEKALATDRDAPFGGIIAANRPVDLDLARAIAVVGHLKRITVSASSLSLRPRNSCPAGHRTAPLVV